tara:strand:- start:22 stop:150 length:129 start_codon:yes stop_codon:yes gene_type:complete
MIFGLLKESIIRNKNEKIKINNIIVGGNENQFFIFSVTRGMS